jgi:predicted metal-dependent phosphoesterase TrpH
MYKYKFETHLHTSEASACGQATGAEMMRGCKQAGYSGAVVTDHFFNGYCAIRGEYNWEEKVRLFVRGYENAKREGDEIGIDVYFGFEYHCGGGMEFLIYNFDEAQLLAYPEIMTDSFEIVAKRVHDAGGFIIHAHPFREETYIKQPGLIMPELTDAVEIVNTGNRNPQWDKSAREYAEKYNLCKIGGSDTHWTSSIKSGVAFAQKPESLEDMINLIKQNKHIVLC